MQLSYRTCLYSYLLLYSDDMIIHMYACYSPCRNTHYSVDRINRLLLYSYNTGNSGCMIYTTETQGPHARGQTMSARLCYNYITYYLHFQLSDSCD